MSYKTILVHLHDPRRQRALLAVSVGLARTFDAHLVGLSVLPPVVIVPGIGGGGAMVIEDHRQAYLTQQVGMKAAFEEATRGQTFVAEWREADAECDNTVSRLLDHGRCADLIIASQQDPDWPSSELLEAPERLVLESGRPVLLLPNTGEIKAIGRRVIVAWNGRREATRAAFAAVPLLAKAQSVTVVWVNPQDESEASGDLPGAELCAALARHGVRCEGMSVPKPSDDAGAALLAAAREREADLLVMGCYGHSRLKELVFGGASRHILASMNLPVLMAH